MEAIEDASVEAAVLWLAQTILASLLLDKLDAWLRQVGLAGDTEKLRSEIEEVEVLVAAVKGRAAGNRLLARSLARLKELLYDADDVVDELDYYRLQHQLQGVTLDCAIETDGDGAEQVDASRDNAGMLSGSDRKKRSKAWEEFRITSVDGKPAEAQCIHCHKVVRCETSKGTSVLHNHLKSDSCKRKRAAIEQTPNPSSADDGAQNGATVATHDSDSRKRMRIDEAPAHNTAANTHLWNKTEFCNRIQQKTHQLREAINEVQKLYGSGSVANSNLCQNTAADPCRRTSSLVQRKMYGRDAEKNLIIKCMTGDKSDGVIILPIVGIGGIGKTALAQLVYNDPIVKSHFEHRLWVWVSEKFDEVRLTREMLDFVSKEKQAGISSLAKLQEILVSHVTSKRCLLILDDVWDDLDDDTWTKLLAPLRSDNAKGNAILVTTRKLSVAKAVGTVKPVQLSALEDDDFLLLFKACAFGDDKREEYPSLNIIGRQMAEKLHGNPLAAGTAGMLLRQHLTIDNWSNILKNEKWKSLHLSRGIMPALKLSYDQLPYYLQQCYLYSSIFPNDYQFLSNELVCIWISQGFVKSGQSTQRLEEIGRGYLTELVDSGFFQQVEGKESTSGNQTCYVMCGLMHDFARLVSSTECAAIDGLKCNNLMPTIRHLSIVANSHDGNILCKEKFEVLQKAARNLRTLVLIGKYDHEFFKSFLDIFQKAQCLRLLHISATNADCDSFMCNLVNSNHLRYLKLENKENSGALPQASSKFYHLQVLDVAKFCDPETPNGMNCLVSLRHLIAPGGVYSSIPSIGKMTSLQELCNFTIQDSSEIIQLESMNELVQLGVHQLQNVNGDEACGAKLRDKQHLEKLHLSWKYNLFQDEYDSVLERLEPYHNLKHLHISGYTGATSPTWLATSVTVLQTLQLEGCGEWKILPSLERLPFLAKLKLRNMRQVIEVSIPSLEELMLIKMPKLEKCSCNSLRDLNSSLRVLKIEECDALKAFPLFESCEKLKIEQESWLSHLSELTIRDCPHLLVSHPLPPSSSVCKLSIAGVSTLPTIEGLSNGELVIGAVLFFEHEDILVDENFDELTKLDDKILSFHNLRALTHLEIADWQNLTYISFEGFRQLISLKSLEIVCCKKLFSPDVLLEHTHEDMVGANFNAFPSLERLSIESCGIAGKWLSVMLRHAPALEELRLGLCPQISGLLVEGKESSLNRTSDPRASSAGNPDDALTSSTPDGLLCIPLNLTSSLKKIYIFNLTIQGNEESFSRLTSLEELEISGEKPQPCFPGILTHLKKLEIVNSDLEFLQLDSCTALEELIIHDLLSLTALEGLQFLGGLRHLAVSACPAIPPYLLRLSSQGYELCPRLERLEIDDFYFLTTSFCKHLTSLHSLTVEDRREQKYKQERALQLLTSLQELRFKNCNKLEDLPVGLHSLPSLKRLEISSCYRISRLPEKGLPPSLEELELNGCSKELTEQCRGLDTSMLKVNIGWTCDRTGHWVAC